jgi:hypothetical protein
VADATTDAPETTPVAALAIPLAAAAVEIAAPVALAAEASPVAVAPKHVLNKGG